MPRNSKRLAPRRQSGVEASPCRRLCVNAGYPKVTVKKANDYLAFSRGFSTDDCALSLKFTYDRRV
ncbi:hypothetical protein A8H26_06390 [Pluralibacter gergoviae]|nr:hypothetical protein A8H26_06390 [Pluralibacter gergoviae]